MSWWTVLKYFVLGIFVSAEWIEEQRRTHGMRSLARNSGLNFLGKLSLPGALCLYGTPFQAVNGLKTSNLIDGTLRGLHVVVFDCRVMEKEEWQRTVIAARTTPDVFTSPAHHPELQLIHIGGWSVLFYPKGSAATHGNGLMSIEEVEEHLGSIANEATRIG